MKTDVKEIGKRIKQLRKEKNYSLEKLAGILSDSPYLLNVSRQRMSGIEKGNNKRPLNINELSALSEVFNCDIGYLLCEIKEKTYDNKAIHEKTALSELAINNIISNAENDGAMSVINAILENNDLYDFVIRDVLWTTQFTLHNRLKAFRNDEYKLIKAAGLLNHKVNTINKSLYIKFKEYIEHEHIEIKPQYVNITQYDIIKMIDESEKNFAAYNFQLSRSGSKMFENVISDLLEKDYNDLLNL